MNGGIPLRKVWGEWQFWEFSSYFADNVMISWVLNKSSTKNTLKNEVIAPKESAKFIFSHFYKSWLHEALESLLKCIFQPNAMQSSRFSLKFCVIKVDDGKTNKTFYI